MARTAKQANNAGERARYNDQRGRWEARVTLGYAGGVRKRRLITGPTERDCRVALQQAVAAVASGRLTADSAATVADYARHWSEVVLPTEGLAPKTLAGYRQALRLWVLPAVGSYRLDGKGALGVPHVEAMLADMRAKDLGWATQSHAKVVLGKMLHSAHRSRLVSENVARLATSPKDEGAERKVKALRPAELAALLEAFSSPGRCRWYPLVLLHAATGLRPGELLGLWWSDVDLDTRMVQVSRSRSMVGDMSLKAPKRPRSRRTVPVVDGAGVVEALRAWKAAQSAERLAAGSLWHDRWGPLMFTRPEGQPVDDATYRQVFARACQEAQIGHHSPHDLRHTYATHLLELGYPIHHVAELIGDTSATVEKSYSHVLRPKIETAAGISSLLPARV